MNLMKIGGIALIAIIGIFFLLPALADISSGSSGGIGGGASGYSGDYGVSSGVPEESLSRLPEQISSSLSEQISTSPLETVFGKATSNRDVTGYGTPYTITRDGIDYIYSGEGYIPLPKEGSTGAGLSGISEWGQKVSSVPTRPDPSKDPFGALEWDVANAKTTTGTGKETSQVLEISDVRGRETLGKAIGDAPIGSNISSLLAKSPKTQYAGETGKEHSQVLSSQNSFGRTSEGQGGLGGYTPAGLQEYYRLKAIDPTTRPAGG